MKKNKFKPLIDLLSEKQINKTKNKYNFYYV